MGNWDVSKPNNDGEPSKDTISRKAVHEAITRWAGSMSVLIALPTREVRPLLDSIHELPPVTPQPKMGRWISLDDFRGKYNERGFMCSECGEHSDYEENFCPNCGARMQEMEE
jgi:hypothetical protein